MFHRYDRDFLLQFQSFCKARPPNLARLDVLGLEPRDPAVLVTRGGSGRHRNNNTLAAPLPHHSLVGPGLGGGLGFGIAAASSFGSMGNFGSRANLTSEERFAMARAGNSSVSGIPFVAGQTPTQETASQGGDVQVNVLLNELLTENFDSISDQIIARANKSRQERDGHSLIEVIRHLFGKAIDEPTRSDIYARLCRKMMPRISPQIQIDGLMNAQGKPIAGGQLIRKFLLEHCQGDFDRRWARKETTADAAAAEDDAANVADAGKDADTEEVALNSDEDPAAQRAKLQGVIKFMGELFKVQLLTEPIMHEYVKKFLGGDAENPEEENMESLCTLLTTVGAVLDTPKARAHLNSYFSRVKEFAQSPNVSPRMQLMLQVYSIIFLFAHTLSCIDHLLGLD
jgi:translation initiation factor 4G